MKYFWIIMIILLLVMSASATTLVYLDFQEKKAASLVTDFEGCAQAMNIIQESYPPVCRTPDGRSFTQDIGDELDKMGVFRVSAPRPNQSVLSPLLISGEARGTWFFEGSLPVRLLDVTGNEIASGIAEAQGEWMTEAFVPFSLSLTFPDPPTAEGDLLFEKSNPSGLPEQADSFRIPVRFSNALDLVR